jgi:hypothetical protein
MSGFDLIVVPDNEDEDAALVFVDGRVDGRPYRLLLDTGAATTCLMRDDYTSSFPSQGAKKSSGVFAAAARGEIITIPRIELGPIVKSDFPVARIAAISDDIRSLVGMDLLKDVACHFLFDEGRVEVNPPAEPDVYSMEALILDQTNHPYVELRFDTATADAVWDTGAGITVADLTFVREHPPFFREIGRSLGTDSTGTTMETPVFEMSGAALGGATFPPHTVAGVDLSDVNATIAKPMDLILGYSTLSKANWWFDFPRRQWAITRIPESA